MCYLLREPNTSPRPEPQGTPARPGTLRPRWVAAAGLALAATVAVAALVTAPPAQAPEPVRQATGLVPVVNRADARPASDAMTRTALPADDDVPAGTGPVKAGIGHCHDSL